LAVTSVYCYTCNVECVGVNGNCYSDATAIYTCNNGLYCNVNYTSATAACRTSLAVGAACTDSSQCAGDETACSASNVCTTLSYTATVGQTCSATTMCATQDLYCNSGACAVAPTAAGATCTSVCVGTSTCQFGVCITQYSVANGGRCTEYSDNECVPGSYCNGTAGGSTFTCVTAPTTSSGRACNQDTDCNIGEQCGCKSYGATASSTCIAISTASSAYAAAVNNYDSCITTNKCSASADTCAACKSQICALYVYDASSPAGIPTCGYTTDLTAYCAGSSSDASVLAVGAVAFVAGAALLF